MLYSHSFLGGLAQLGERLTGSQEVSGSIPLISTKGKRRKPVLTKKRAFFSFYRQINISTSQAHPKEYLYAPQKRRSKKQLERLFHIHRHKKSSPRFEDCPTGRNLSNYLILLPLLFHSKPYNQTFHTRLVHLL